MSLAAAAVRRPVTTIAATLALVLLGAVSLGRLPVALLPDVTLPVLTIRTIYPGAAATEASRFVAEPVEEAVAATPGLVELRSVSRNGEVTTTARFAWGTDMAATVLAVQSLTGTITERSIFAFIALIGWIILLWRNREHVSGQPILFQEFSISPRLGGEFCGGGFVGMSFEVGEGAN